MTQLRVSCVFQKEQLLVALIHPEILLHNHPEANPSSHQEKALQVPKAVFAKLQSGQSFSEKIFNVALSLPLPDGPPQERDRPV